MQKTFFRSLILLIFLNLLVKPVWIFGIDRQVQNITGFAEYGKYFALLNLTMVFNFLLDPGITTYYNQQIASHGRKKEGFFSKVIIAKLILSVIYSAVILVIASVTMITDWNLLGLLILLQILTSFLLLVRAYLTATQHYARDAAISVADKLIVIIVAGAAIIAPAMMGKISIHFFVAIQVCAVAISIIAALILSVKEFAPVKPGFSGIIKDIIAPSLPFAMNIFFMSLMARGDSFLLEQLHPQGDSEAGIYASSFRLLDALNMVGFLFAGFLLPYVARHQNDSDNIQSVILPCRNLLLVYSIVAVAFVIAVPGFVNTVLYHHSDSYKEKVLMLTILGLPSMALVHIYGTTLTATGNIRTFVMISLVFALVNFCSNLFFAGRFGAIACATIACCTQTVFAATTIYFSSKKTGMPLQWISIAEAVIVAVLFWLIMKMGNYLNWNVLVIAILAVLIIGLVMIFTGRISIKQILKMVTEN